MKRVLSLLLLVTAAGCEFELTALDFQPQPPRLHVQVRSEPGQPLIVQAVFTSGVTDRGRARAYADDGLRLDGTRYAPTVTNAAGARTYHIQLPGRADAPLRVEAPHVRGVSRPGELVVHIVHIDTEAVAVAPGSDIRIDLSLMTTAQARPAVEWRAALRSAAGVHLTVLRERDTAPAAITLPASFLPTGFNSGFVDITGLIAPMPPTWLAGYEVSVLSEFAATLPVHVVRED